MIGWFLRLLGMHRYVFEERTVWAYYLEEARSQLENYRSPLIETDDRAIG